jgi:hypothetical protein
LFDKVQRSGEDSLSSSSTCSPTESSEEHKSGTNFLNHISSKNKHISSRKLEVTGYNVINMFESGWNLDLVNEFPNVELHRITLKAVDNAVVMLPELEPPRCHILAAVAA